MRLTLVLRNLLRWVARQRRAAPDESLLANVADAIRPAESLITSEAYMVAQHIVRQREHRVAGVYLYVQCRGATPYKRGPDLRSTSRSR